MLDTIKQGSSGDIVKVAQYLTKYCARKEASGYYDENFENHIRQWQTDNGLTSDGIIGPDTWSTISKKAPTCSTSKNKTSAETCAVQILVGGLSVDGIYGTKTKKAVAAYQSSVGLGADGICGQKTWNSLICNSGKIDPDIHYKILNKCVHYLQWDSKWKNVKYSTHTNAQTIGNSGCGPTSMAMIMATFIDPNITPVEMCKLAVDGGFRTYDSGTAWGFYEFVFKRYPQFSKFIQTKSLETLKAALKDGALAVCSMNGNDNFFWTRSGHFIVARGYDDEYIYANDPNNRTVPRKQKQNKFKSCMKQAFIFWPAVSGDKPNEEVKETKSGEAPVGIGTTGTNIIDISKWQGNIDFAALRSEVSFVIVRASCGSDKDVKFDEYANAMIKNGIPFGVYCYSYAGTEAKAKDEAQKIVTYASKYNPLFYVMDAEENKITNAAIREFVAELRRQGVQRTVCYVAHNHYKDYGFDTIRELFDAVWIPRYGKNDGTINGATKPDYPCDLWQFTSNGKINGIGGRVDMNVITGDGHDLNWFLGK